MSLELQFETLVEALYFEAKVAGPPRGVTFQGDDGEEERVLYMEALEHARGRAGSLQRLGVAPRERVLVLLPTSSDFLHVFFGLLLVGGVPCPVSPPSSFGDMAGFAERLGRTASYLGARYLITTEAFRDLLGEPGVPGVDVLLAELLTADARANGPAFTPVHVGPHDTAFIQCTSGSTGPQKGVELTHENLISDVHQIGWCLDVKPADVPVCWLPLYHDMGLIGCLLFSIYWNLDAVFLSPFRFLRQPASWLQAIAKHRGSISPAPNFAYSYVTSRAKDGELEGLDLSSFRIALCGAEPIDPRTLQRFEERFRRFGLPPHAVCPCYGLAEATLAVTFHPIESPLVWERVAREPLAARGEVVDVGRDDPSGVDVVSCGRPVPETRVRIVAEDGAVLPELRAGRIQVSGPTVMRGYHALPDATAAVLREGWLDTGDLGYLRDGALRVTGRAKDLVIIRGRNYLPSDFEWAAEEVPGVRRGNVIALGLMDERQGTEALHLLCETDTEGDPEREALRRAILTRVTERTQVAPAAIELLPRNTIPKTSSGKLQRSKARAEYLERIAARMQAPG